MTKSKVLPCGRTRADLAKDLKRLEKLVEVTKAAMEGAEIEASVCGYDFWMDDRFDPLDGLFHRVKPTSKKGATS